MKDENNDKLTFKDKWFEDYNKKDLKMVLIKGIIAMLASVFIGVFIDYLLFMINASFTVGMFVVGTMTGLIVQKSHEKYHIKYSLITIILVLIGMILLNMLRLFLINNFKNIGPLLSNGTTYMIIFLYPIKVFITAIKIGNIGNYIFSIIELAIYIGSFFVAYYLSKRKETNTEEEK